MAIVQNMWMNRISLTIQMCSSIFLPSPAWMKLVSILVSALSLLCTLNFYFYNEVLKSGDQKYLHYLWRNTVSQIWKILQNQVWLCFKSNTSNFMPCSSIYDKINATVKTSQYSPVPSAQFGHWNTLRDKRLKSVNLVIPCENIARIVKLQ